ncbi:MAG: phosphate acyltransferase [Tissierellaceae bacterium]
MLKDFRDLISRVKEMEVSTVCVANAEDEEILRAVKIATDMGFARSILVGKGDKIQSLADKLGLRNYNIVNVEDIDDVALEAVKIVRSGGADVLMKGLINTSSYMRAVLNRDHGLRTGRLLSLLAVYELKEYHKLLYCTDSGVNVNPNLEQKKDILANALGALEGIGLSQPKVACLTANELVDPKIQSTVDAGALVEMAKRGEFSKCLIEGPIAFDVAFDPKAAEHKGIRSSISGDVDLLVFPNMETGNALGKSWLHFNEARWAGIILGGLKPVILGSRSDTAEIKVNSIALGCLAAAK